jgi:hypothetical protein
MYTKDLADIVTKAGFVCHGYADDTQLYQYCSPTAPEVTKLSEAFAACLESVTQWTYSNRLQLNPQKTECVWFHSPSCGLTDYPTLSIGSVSIQPVAAARSLGIWFDQHLSFDQQITTLSKLCFYQLRQLRPVCKQVDRSTAQSILQAFVSSRLDYCNVLYAGLPTTKLARLQRIQNAAARLYSGCSRYEHITPVLRELHWLPVASRVVFKVATIVYKAHHNLAPNYIVELCPPAGHLHQHNLRSVTRHDLATIRTLTFRIGDRTFARSAAEIWNNLPTDLRASQSVSTFCKHLKTALFHDAYSAQ